MPWLRLYVEKEFKKAKTSKKENNDAETMCCLAIVFGCLGKPGKKYYSLLHIGGSNGHMSNSVDYTSPLPFPPQNGRGWGAYKAPFCGKW